MRQLDFRPNAIARSLASRRSRILALTFPAAENRFGNTIMEFVSSAAAAARDSGYHLVVWPYAVEQADEMCDMSQQGLADGVIVMEVRVDDPRIKALTAAQVPFTLIGRGRPDTDNRSVDIDFDHTAEMAVEPSDRSRTPTHRISEPFRVQPAARLRTDRAGPGRVSGGDGPARIGAVHALLRRESTRRASRDERHAEENPDLTALVAMNEDALFGVVAGAAPPGCRCAS